MKRSIALAAVLIAFCPVIASAAGFPITFSAKGGFGVGYYSMGELNNHLTQMKQELGTTVSELDNGVNIYFEGRVWILDRVAGIVGYERFWVETSLNVEPTSITYKAPADVYVLGGAVRILTLPEIVDINAGVRGSFAHAIYGTNQDSESVLREYKKNDYGWDIFAEANTNFLRPVEVGFILGYRSLSIEGFKDKFQHVVNFTTTGEPVAIDYSGAFFYLTAGVRLW